MRRPFTDTRGAPGALLVITRYRLSTAVYRLVAQRATAAYTRAHRCIHRQRLERGLGRCNRSLRRARSAGSVVACSPAASSAMVIAETATSELRGLLERAIDDLPTPIAWCMC